MKANVWSYLTGFIFGVGLILAGMVDPAKVIGFLDLFGGAWDPSLAFVMGGAVAVHFIAFRVITKRHSPLFDAKFHLPTRTDLDPKLIGGAAIFGIGWGLGGFCPGPGLTSLGAGSAAAAVFVVTMLLGMWVQHQTASTTSKLTPPLTPRPRPGA